MIFDSWIVHVVASAIGFACWLLFRDWERARSDRDKAREALRGYVPGVGYGVIARPGACYDPPDSPSGVIPASGLSIPMPACKPPPEYQINSRVPYSVCFETGMRIRSGHLRASMGYIPPAPPIPMPPVKPPSDSGCDYCGHTRRQPSGRCANCGAMVQANSPRPPIVLEPVVLWK